MCSNPMEHFVQVVHCTHNVVVERTHKCLEDNWAPLGIVQSEGHLYSSRTFWINFTVEIFILSFSFPDMCKHFDWLYSRSALVGWRWLHLSWMAQQARWLSALPSSANTSLKTSDLLLHSAWQVAAVSQAVSRPPNSFSSGFQPHSRKVNPVIGFICPEAFVSSVFLLRANKFRAPPLPGANFSKYEHHLF